MHDFVHWLIFMNDLIPFGKYKGQPVEQLRNDPDYVEWLMGQDWFVQRFGGIRTLIVNNFAEPDSTPEHNNLQAKFLDEVFTVTVLRAGFPNWFKAFDEYEHNLANAKSIVPESHGEMNITDECRIHFETREGWDVEVEIDKCFPPMYCERRDKNYFHGRFALELKPALGDEYPRVLREVKSRRRPSEHRGLLVYCERFTATGAKLDQVRKIFSSSGISLLLASEVQ
jgi:uncharacterized protein (DUF3820 family)